MSIEGASLRTPPGVPTVVSANTTAENLGILDQYITVCAAGGDLTLRFGGADVGAAQTTDWPLAEGEKESFFITRGKSYVSIQGTGALKWVIG